MISLNLAWAAVFECNVVRNRQFVCAGDRCVVASSPASMNMKSEAGMIILLKCELQVSIQLARYDTEEPVKVIRISRGLCGCTGIN